MSDGLGEFFITGFPPGNITNVAASFGSVDQSSVIGGSGIDGTAAGPSNVLQVSGTTLLLQDFALPVELTSFIIIQLRIRLEDCKALLKW